MAPQVPAHIITINSSDDDDELDAALPDEELHTEAASTEAGAQPSARGERIEADEAADLKGAAPAAPAKKKVAAPPQHPGSPKKPAAKRGGLLAATKNARLDLAAEAESGELPLMLPEKLPLNKALLELEPRNGNATDLTGDAGAVGRVMVSSAAGDTEVRIDLKGMVYMATTVPCATTLCVVNIGATEAKVECVLSSFLQLREDPGACMEDEGAADLFADDEDNYQMGAPNQGEKSNEKPAGKKAQAGGKARLAGSTLKARGGTSKPRPKGPAKPRKPAAKKASKSKG